MAFSANIVSNITGCSSESRVELRLVSEADKIMRWSSVYAGSPTQKHWLRHIKYACRCSDTSERNGEREDHSQLDNA